MKTKYERSFVARLEERLSSADCLIQVIVGPRQVGKTTGIKHLLARYSKKYHYANADDLLVTDRTWLLEQWQRAEMMGEGALLVIDEIQKIPNWSETLKSLWDRSSARLRVVVLGSSSLQIQSGLCESLAGRFEITKVFHWTFYEMKQAFGYDLERFLVYGGYPGSVSFERDYDRWYSYLKDSIVEAVIGRDILLNQKVGRPALFRQAFEILCHYPAQEISFTKLLGQLQDKGNTDLVKYYLELYAGVFLIHSLEKYSAKGYLTRSSSPKILVACPALYTMNEGPRVLDDRDKPGRIFEMIVGNQLMQLPGELYYWRERNDEVDFIYRYQGRIFAIEVKSGRHKTEKGLEAFIRKFPDARPIIITPDIFPIFSQDPFKFLSKHGN
ncbi:MAG: ATP-binding protein [Candidatus Riflebacteria bacterium]|nr:ATP-binding protein [Candidatus Riflebacteria bacterium]